MSVLEEKSYRFAIRIVKLNKYLNEKHNEYVLSKQLLRSGTAIGALIAEAQYAQSLADFVNKLQISLKEANESKYWIRLLADCGYINVQMSENIIPDVDELLKLLTSSINTTKEKIK